MNIYKQNQKTLVYSSEENKIHGRKAQPSAVKDIRQNHWISSNSHWKKLIKNELLSSQDLFSIFDKKNHRNFYNIHSSKIQITLLWLDTRLTVIFMHILSIIHLRIYIYIFLLSHVLFYLYVQTNQ